MKRFLVLAGLITFYFLSLESFSKETKVNGHIIKPSSDLNFANLANSYLEKANLKNSNLWSANLKRQT